MASREVIVNAIQQGDDQVQRIFEGLSDQQLQTPVHEGDSGWTAKQVLAHVAARQQVNDRLLAMAAGDGNALASIGSIDDWNSALVADRVNLSKEELLAEFHTVQQTLIARVNDLSDERLTQVVSLPQGPVALGDLLAMAGGAHAAHHAQEVEGAISRIGD